MVTHALVASLLGYWASDHRLFNVQLLEDGQAFSFKRAGAEIKSVDQYLERVLYVSDGLSSKVAGVGFSNDPRGTDRPSDRPTMTVSLLEWNELGGLWEDGFASMGDAQFYGGLRAPNHFHDPLAFEGGYTGIKTETGFTAHWVKAKTGKPVVDLFRAGVSATRWAQGGSSSERNEWGYPTISAGFTEFLTKQTAEDRERGLAAAFRSLGQVEHLVTDNTVPDHARDLAHPGQGFEEWLNQKPDAFRATPQPWPKMPLERIERGGLRAFWDQDVYSGASPADGLAEGAGIAEFTQANFLAWNRFTPPYVHLPYLFFNPGAGLFERDILYFTTVPPTAGVGFERMPWPRLTGPDLSGFFGAEPPGQSFPKCIAKKKGDRNIISADCWAAYALPLMQRAKGTALTVLTLAMPPLRAELVPEPGDLTRFRVRLWNLGNGPGDSVTLRLDEVSFTSVRFDGEAMGTVPVEDAQGTPLAPGGTPWTSQPFSLTLKEQGILKLSTYSGVVLKARLAGADPAQVNFAVPIPNGFPVVNQLTSTVTLSPQTYATNVQSNCCNTTCTSCGENAEYVQPVRQDITGVIKRYSSHLDSLGRPATGDTLEAIDKDTRVAGVALVAWGSVGGRYDAPIRPANSNLEMTSPLFEKRGDMWLRKESAPDEADPDQLDFRIALDVRDFFGASAGSYGATQTVHLLVWMTSGAVYTQSLALWPMRRPETVDVALAAHACDDLNSIRSMQYEAAGGCKSSRSGTPTCDLGAWTTSLRSFIFGPLRGIGTADVEYFSLYPNLKLLRLGGVDVSTLSATCTAPTSFGASFSIRCFSDYNSFIMDNVVTTGVGACPTIPPQPPLARTATMRPEWSPELKTFLGKMFGRTDAPAFQDVELR